MRRVNIKVFKASVIRQLGDLPVEITDRGRPIAYILAVKPTEKPVETPEPIEKEADVQLPFYVY